MKDPISVTVQFKNLTIFEEAREVEQEVPTLWTAARNMFTGPCRRRAPKIRRTLVDGVTGEFKPGTMTLVSRASIHASTRT